MSGYSRRRLLAVGTAVGIGTVAGCLDNGETAEAIPDGDGPVLETVRLENLNSSPHTLDLIIQWGDEIEYWDEHELSAISDSDTSSRLLAEGWPTDPGEFQLTVRLDDGTRKRVSSTELPERDCLNLLVLVSRAGELSILTDIGGDCVDDAAGTDDTADTRTDDTDTDTAETGDTDDTAGADDTE